MNQLHAHTSLLFAVALVAGCAEPQSPDQPAANPFGDATVATINGEPLYASIFDAYSLARLQKPAVDLSDDEREGLLDEMIQFQLMAAAAVEAGLPEEQDIAIDMELQRLRMLSRVLSTRHLEDNPASEGELQAAYEENVEQLSGLQYKARHILVDEESEAVEIIEELQGGADFAQLAMDRSTGPSGPNGGDLGWFSANTMVTPFADAVRSMEVGTFSEQPVQTRFGWHVILLEDSEDQQPPALDAVRADITGLVEQQKIGELLDSMREAAEIIIGDSG